MIDLIDRQKLIAKCRPGGDLYSELLESEELIEVLKEEPSVEVWPIQKGKWIDVPRTKDTKKCSVCGCKCQRFTYCNTDYCGNCGAMMLGVEYEID